MKVREILPIINLVRRKKKANPVDSKTDPLTNFIDVFGGMAGYANPSRSGDKRAIQS